MRNSQLRVIISLIDAIVNANLAYLETNYSTRQSVGELIKQFICVTIIICRRERISIGIYSLEQEYIQH